MGQVDIESKASKYINYNGIIKVRGHVFGIIGKLIMVRRDNSIVIIDNEDL